MLPGAPQPVLRKPPGDKYWAVAEIPLDNAYPTGGYSLAALAALLQWNLVEHVIPFTMGPTLTATIADFSWDQVNLKLKLYAAAGTELANAGDASALKLYCMVYGN
jgi:hypothetical protein